jgi:dihydrofolate reductase
MLSIHPLVLGAGHRLFADGFAPATFQLVDTTPTTTGVIIATYRSRPSAAADEDVAE